MKATNKYERFIKHIKKKIKLTTHAFRLSSFSGRISGQKVLLTSIPKTGTNLIYQLLYRLPYYRFYTGRGLRPWMFESNSALAKKVSKTKKGQILPGHIPAFDAVLERVENENIKVLFMIRDPRDVLLSHLKYVTNIDKTHPTHTFFDELKDDDARIEALLFGVDGVVESIPTVYSNYMKWLKCNSAITVKFENLVGEQGGGVRKNQIMEIQKILNHLKLSLPGKVVEDLAHEIFDTDSETFRSGRINQWKKQYKPNQLSLLKKELGTTLIEYGYEEDDNW